MDYFDNLYEKCEDCGYKCPIMQIIIKDTSEGQTIYCPDCVRHHKFLEQTEKELAKKWNIDLYKYGKEVEKEEYKLLKQSEKLEKQEEKEQKKKEKERRKNK